MICHVPPAPIVQKLFTSGQSRYHLLQVVFIRGQLSQESTVLSLHQGRMLIGDVETKVYTVASIFCELSATV